MTRQTMTPGKRDICVRYGMKTQRSGETREKAIKRACVVFGYLDPVLTFDAETGDLSNITFTPANTNTPY